MPDLPSGNVTFLFTDIEGSTRRWEHLPEAMAAALELHDRLIREAVQARGGLIYKTIGDAFQIAFGAPAAALSAAVDAQTALAEADWAALDLDLGPVRVRMALDIVRAFPSGSDYRSPGLNRVARLLAAGHGGQVLLTADIEAALVGSAPPGIVLRALGVHRLKDLTAPLAIYQAVAPGLPDITRPPRTAGAVTTHDRIMVVDDQASPAKAAPRAAGDLLAGLRAVVSGQSDAIRLTPGEVATLVGHRPADLEAYRLIRVAEWSQPRYRLDERFVDLSLLVDVGGDDPAGRWVVDERRFTDLRDALAEVPDPCLVVLGSPGSGKSTLLRRLELDLAIDSLRGMADPRGAGAATSAAGNDAQTAADRVTFFIQLNHYQGSAPGEAPPAPRAWLAARWAARYPDLPALDDLLATGRVVLLLDALNEMPHADMADYRARVKAWQAFIYEVATESPGNRVLFSCRSLDYSAPLSTPTLPVPQLRIEPMSDERMARFLRLYSPQRGDEVWQRLRGSSQQGLLRTPYFLALLVQQVEIEGKLPEGHAALFTGFLRQVLRREVERGHRLFDPDRLLSARDCRRIVQTHSWRTPYDLPEQGPLIPKLAGLAYAMQARAAARDVSQVRVDYDTALDLLVHPRAEEIIAAGVALSVLDEDVAGDEVMFFHQLLQEYFAARRMAEGLEPALVRTPWESSEMRPGLAETLAALAPSDPLPPPEPTGWEESAVLAVAMAPDPDAFIGAIAAENLALAARCAANREARVGVAVRTDLAWRLVERSRDPDADLRARIAAGLYLGELGDPRFERREGPYGAYLLPPMVEIPGGEYPIGEDDGPPEEAPRHRVALAPFAVGRFALTNAEWACFIAAGGYEDDRWWATPAALAWQRGEGTAEGSRWDFRTWRKRLLADPDLLESRYRAGRVPESIYRGWRMRLAMGEDEFEAHLIEKWPSGKKRAPERWLDAGFNGPAQPVVGISWFEALAYASWLAAQASLPFRLPTEVEWAAAARGPGGRRYAWGDAFDPLRANTTEAHVRRTTPVGVFPAGDTPEGAADLTGNCFEWTSSLYGLAGEAPSFVYPYRAGDGREDLAAPAGISRVARGGAWSVGAGEGTASRRLAVLPDHRGTDAGARLARG